MSRRFVPFWMISVRRRPTAFLCLLFLSFGAVMLSTLGPLVLQSAKQFTLGEATAASDNTSTALVSVSETMAGQSVIGASTAKSIVDRVLSGPETNDVLWRDPLVGVESSTEFLWTVPARQDVSGSAPVTGLGYLDGCDGLSIVTGRCPEGATEVMLPGSVHNVKVGDRIVVSPPAELVEPVEPVEPVEYTVSGKYDERKGDGRFWSAPSSVVGVDQPTAPALLVTLDGFDEIGVEGRAYGALFLARPLTLEDVDDARADIVTAEDAAVSSSAAESRSQLHSDLGSVLDRQQRQHDAATVLLTVATVQAVGVSWFAMALAVQRLARVRAREWGLGRLRGLSYGRWLGAIFVEPIVAVVSGAALGFVGGALLATLMVHAVLSPTASVEPMRLFVVAVGVGATVGSLLALVGASIRSARVPLADLLSRTAEPRVLSRAALLAQGGVGLVTLTVLASLTTQGDISGPGVALLAPSLVAVLVGVIGLRVSAVLVGRVARRPPRSLAALLVGRRLGRSTSMLTVGVMVCIGVALSVFSTQLAVATDRVHHDRARAIAGAFTVLKVSMPAGGSFHDAVARADPHGTSAMAVEVYERATNVGRVIAVDTERLATVSTWSAQWSDLGTAETLRERLAPSHNPSFELIGTQVSMTLTDVAPFKGPGSLSEDIDTNLDDVSLRMVVQSESGWHTVDFGSPRDGTLTSTADRFPCGQGCRVVWLGATSSRATDPPFGVQLTVTGIETDQQSAAATQQWLAGDRWRERIGEEWDPARPSRVTVIDDNDPNELTLQLVDRQGSRTASIAPRDAPEPIPALLGSDTVTNDFAGISDAVLGAGPDGSSRLLQIIGHAPALPRLGGEGVLVDLAVLNQVSDPALSKATREVWLTSTADPTITAALEREGVVIESTSTLADIEAASVQEAPNRAAHFGHGLGIVGMAVTVLAFLAVRVISAAGRKDDVLSLMTAGVSKKVLRRTIALEAFLPAGIGAALGAMAGLAGYALTVSRLPLLVEVGATPPPDWSVMIWPVAVLCAAVLAVLALIAAATAFAEVRRTPR